MKTWQAVLLVLALLAVIALGIWAWAAAPCDFYSWQKAGDIPARCVMAP